MSVVWQVRLAAQAELDFSEIVTWTLENFGERQAETYAETLILARHIPSANDQSS